MSGKYLNSGLGTIIICPVECVIPYCTTYILLDYVIPYVKLYHILHYTPSPPGTYYLGTGVLKGPLRIFGGH